MNPHPAPDTRLRTLIRWDVAMTLPVGLAMALLAAPLAAVTGLPEMLLRSVGLALLPYVAWLLWLARRPAVPRGTAWTMVAINALYAIECVLLPLLGWIAPNALGWAFLLVQAMVVGSFALLGTRVLRAPVQRAAMR